MIKTTIIQLFCLSLFFVLFTSCVNTKSIGYFKSAKEGTYQVDANPEALIQKNDILSITITSLNADASIVFNTSNNHVLNSSASNGNLIQSGGYLVNSDGFIQLPILGNVLADGVTKKELRNRIS